MTENYENFLVFQSELNKAKKKNRLPYGDGTS
jgi:hypothetical protein